MYLSLLVIVVARAVKVLPLVLRAKVPAAKIDKGLVNFFIGVHDEGTVGGNGLVYRLPSEHKNLGVFLHALKNNLHTKTGERNT